MSAAAISKQSVLRGYRGLLSCLRRHVSPFAQSGSWAAHVTAEYRKNAHGNVLCVCVVFVLVGLCVLFFFLFFFLFPSRVLGFLAGLCL